MTDIEIIRELERRVGRPFHYEMEQDRCVALDLTSDDCLYHGLVRHHSMDEKQWILSLVCRLTRLRRLNLRRNKFQQLPPAFRDLQELEELNLGSNLLRRVPEVLSGLRNLRYLHLGNNDLSELPEFMGGFERLEYLALHKNIRLKSIACVAGLASLKSLNLHFLNLHRMPRFIYRFKQLSNLTLWNIPDLDDEIAGLQELQFFSNCGCPALRRLPEGFAGLKRLRMARLFQNSLETLPEGIGELESLEQLSLYQNCLFSLPDSFARLTRLRKLNLAWNRFKFLPDCLGRMESLQWLAVFENPLKCINFSALPPGTRIERTWPFTTLPKPFLTAGVA